MKFTLLVSVLFFTSGAFACFAQMAQTMSSGIAQQAEIERQAIQDMMRMAENRFKTEKDCRQEMQKVWVDFQTKKREIESEIRKKESRGIRDAELQYQMAVRKLHNECVNQANDQFTPYKEAAYQQVYNNPAGLAAFANNVDSRWKDIYSGCWNGYENQGGLAGKQEDVKLLAQQLSNKIRDIQEDVSDAKESLQELHKISAQLQSDIKDNCRDQRALNAYQEQQSRTMSAIAIGAAQRATSMNQLGAVMSCLDPNSTNNGNDNGTGRTNAL